MGRASHTIELEENSLLAGLAGKTRVTVNSHHHQAVKTIGRKLKITGRALDGVIEAVEGIDSNQWIIGVEWHPELMWRSDEFARQIFTTFIDYAGTRI